MTIDFTVAQAANTVAAGPTGGTAAVPTMRSLVWADFDATLRAAILADINCEQAGQTSQWLEFALIPPYAASGTTLAVQTYFTDRPPAFEFLEIPRASVVAASSSGIVTFDIKLGSTGGVGGTSIFSTLLTIDEGEYTSVTAATPCVLSTTTHTDDQEMTILCTVAGTGVKGALVRMHVNWL